MTLDRVLGAVAAVLLAAQAVTSVVAPPSADEYTGTRGDVVNEVLFAAGLLALAGCLTALRRRATKGAHPLAVAGAGAVLLASSVVATVAAGEERWDAAFVAGFGLMMAGLLAAAISTRSPAPALAMLALVLSLAFFGSGGALALALATAALLREGHRGVPTSEAAPAAR
ncbi:MAG TPA: hypothetical protein VNA12_05930 [Mycobacteriales bacterium]|nr:hypothetical protein [Mycobacteriales bacterium]